MNKRIRTGLISTALIAGSFIGAGVVSAQVDDTVPADTTIEEPADAPADAPADTPADTPADGDDEQRGDCGGRGAEGSQATADLLGITVEDLRAAIEEGQTLAQIAETNGVDVQVVIDAKVTAQTEWIDAAVEAGRLTDAEAADKLADLAERVTTQVNEVRPERGEREPRGPGADGGPDAGAVPAGEEGA